MLQDDHAPLEIPPGLDKERKIGTGAEKGQSPMVSEAEIDDT